MSTIQVEQPSLPSNPIKEYHHGNMSLCQQLGKKRPRSSISTCNSGYTVKQGRRVHFSESESSSNDAIIESVTATHQQDQDANANANTNDHDYANTNTNTNTNNNAWYTKSELAVFTSQARDHVLGFGHRWMDQCTRGYERYDFARAQQKAMTRKIILLLMQQKTFSDEEKSFVAHKSSAWAVEDAFVTGCKDFCEAYHPHMSHLLQHQKHHHQDVDNNSTNNNNNTTADTVSDTASDTSSDTSSTVTTTDHANIQNHDDNNKRKFTSQNQNQSGTTTTSGEGRNVRSRTDYTQH